MRNMKQFLCLIFICLMLTACTGKSNQETITSTMPEQTHTTETSALETVPLPSRNDSPKVATHGNIRPENGASGSQETTLPAQQSPSSPEETNPPPQQTMPAIVDSEVVEGQGGDNDLGIF